MSRETLYRRVGGEVAINAAVDLFYECVLSDPELSPFFVGIPMPRPKGHQAAFLSQALGGPKQYTGASMQGAHARLAIEQHHFDLVASHLVETLRELDVAEEIGDEVAKSVIPLASRVVNTTSATPA